jgi:hypothetical protein
MEPSSRMDGDQSMEPSGGMNNDDQMKEHHLYTTACNASPGHNQNQTSRDIASRKKQKICVMRQEERTCQFHAAGCHERFYVTPYGESTGVLVHQQVIQTDPSSTSPPFVTLMSCGNVACIVALSLAKCQYDSFHSYLGPQLGRSSEPVFVETPMGTTCPSDDDDSSTDG